MTYVVTENCIKCKYMDCVEVCPVDCFYAGENMLVIHPDECIDCGVCEPECPAEAIKPDTEPGLEEWLKLNREYSMKWSNITTQGLAPADAKKMGWHSGQTGFFQPKSARGELAARYCFYKDTGRGKPLMNPKKISRSAAAAIARDSDRQYFESLIRADYERCHPDDSLDDLKRRAHFTKEDKGLLQDWLALAEWRERMLFTNARIMAAEEKLAMQKDILLALKKVIDPELSINVRAAHVSNKIEVALAIIRERLPRRSVDQIDVEDSPWSSERIT